MSAFQSLLQLVLPIVERDQSDTPFGATSALLSKSPTAAFEQSLRDASANFLAISPNEALLVLHLPHAIPPIPSHTHHLLSVEEMHTYVDSLKSNINQNLKRYPWLRVLLETLSLPILKQYKY